MSVEDGVEFEDEPFKDITINDLSHKPMKDSSMARTSNQTGDKKVIEDISRFDSRLEMSILTSMKTIRDRNSLALSPNMPNLKVSSSESDKTNSLID